MDVVSLLLSLVGGAVGGNIGGTLLKPQSLGTAGNSIVGAAGGALASWALGGLGMAGKAPRAATAVSGGLDIGAVLGSVAGGGVGGIVLMVIAGFLWHAMRKTGR